MLLRKIGQLAKISLPEGISMKLFPPVFSSSIIFSTPLSTRFNPNPVSINLLSSPNQYSFSSKKKQQDDLQKGEPKKKSSDRSQKSKSSSNSRTSPNPAQWGQSSLKPKIKIINQKKIPFQVYEIRDELQDNFVNKQQNRRQNLVRMKRMELLGPDDNILQPVSFDVYDKQLFSLDELLALQESEHAKILTKQNSQFSRRFYQKQGLKNQQSELSLKKLNIKQVILLINEKFLNSSPQDKKFLAKALKKLYKSIIKKQNRYQIQFQMANQIEKDNQNTNGNENKSEEDKDDDGALQTRTKRKNHAKLKRAKRKHGKRTHIKND